MSDIIKKQAAHAEHQERSLQKITYPTVFWLFIIGSIIGYFLEGIWCVLQTGTWESHPGTIWGPFCIIYGIGTVSVYLLSVVLKEKHALLQFLCFSLSGAAVEYLSSLFQEVCFGSVSWNYSQHFLNIGGRISLKMTFMWGLLGLLFIQFVYPPLERLQENLQGKFWTTACILFTAFMVINLLVTSAALVRWKNRVHKIPASSHTEQWLDETYDDERMTKRFPRFVFPEP